MNINLTKLTSFVLKVSLTLGEGKEDYPMPIVKLSTGSNTQSYIQ